MPATVGKFGIAKGAAVGRVIVDVPTTRPAEPREIGVEDTVITEPPKTAVWEPITTAEGLRIVADCPATVNCCKGGSGGVVGAGIKEEPTRTPAELKTTGVVDTVMAGPPRRAV